MAAPDANHRSGSTIDPAPTNTTSEEWRYFDEHRHHMVSDRGRVRSERSGKILQQHLNHSGYVVVALWLNGRTGNRLVHQLVASAFLGPRPAGKEINHKNNGRTDNSPTNLEYVTRQENLRHARLFGSTNAGERNGSAKLTAEQVAEIRRLAQPGFRNHRLIAEMYEVSRSLISMIVEGKVWAHV